METICLKNHNNTEPSQVKNTTKTTDNRIAVNMEDVSILGQSLPTPLAGFREVKNAYENGTEEVRRLLMEECTLIYECNVCRNLFRNFANFISHKRIYCKQYSQQYFYSKSEPSSSIIIQRQELQEIEKNTRNEIVKHLTPTANPITELLHNCTNETAILELEGVPTTAQAVYQTLKLQPTDSIKTEIDEVRHLLNDNVMLAADGKALNILNNPRQKTDEKTAFTCKICHVSFQTEKTLNIHFQKKHNSAAYVFQCPTCSLTFLQPAAVIRHLANEHKKPMKHIRKMRDTILRKRLQMTDVHVKGASRELKRLQLTENTKDMENRNGNGTANITNCREKPIISTCSYCKKQFERRAVLSAHLQNCPLKKSSTNSTNPLLTKRLRVLPLKVLQETTATACEIVKDEEEQKKIISEINVNKDESKVMKDYTEQMNDSKDKEQINSLLDEMFENLEKTDFGEGLQTVSFDKLNELMTEQESTITKVLLQEEKEKHPLLAASPSPSTPPQPLEVKNYNKDKDKNKNHVENSVDETTTKVETKKPSRLADPSKQLTCRCKICNKQFNALSNLRRHISMFHYRARRFGCTLCEYRAFRRYDIVNHLVFVHKMTADRELMATEYVSVHEVNYSKDDVEGDIVVVANGEDNNNKYEIEQQAEPKSNTSKRKHRNSVPLATSTPLNGNIKMAKQKLRKTAVDSNGKIVQRRPIRNRIKPENKDFVYDLSNLQEENRANLKRRNTLFADNKDGIPIELAPPPIKIVPYRLRTEPLLPANKTSIKGYMERIYRAAVSQGLAAPSTVPELPTERPLMRPRLISACRSDLTPVPIIETNELEAARLQSAMLDDSFLEKLAKRTNSSFRMKPLLSMQQHSPLNCLLQKFDTSLQLNNNNKGTATDNDVKMDAMENGVSSTTPPPPPPSSSSSIPTSEQRCLKDELDEKPLLDTLMPLQSILDAGQQQPQSSEITPNGKWILETANPPPTPKKRVSLMQRLAENRINRIKRRDSVLHTPAQQ